jgi:hypothetical protein
MAQENVEIARRVFDALNRGDLPEVMNEMATGFTFDFSRSRNFERGVYGREEIPGLQDAFGGVAQVTFFQGRDEAAGPPE